MSRITPLKQLWLHPLGHGFTLALVSLLAGCESVSFGGEPAIATDTPTIPPATAQPYGVDGTMDEQDLTLLLHLQFPQSYDAVQANLGFPARRDASGDYYQIKGTKNWVAIWYEGNRAVGYQFSE